jgi:hypothetical protein
MKRGGELRICVRTQKKRGSTAEDINGSPVDAFHMPALVANMKSM